MAKIIKFSNNARSAMLEGIKILYDATRVTLGPKGRNVIIEQDFGYPLIINDGVTIAKSIELSDHLANMGANLIIEAATKTNDLVGDGTTTAIILASNLIFEGIKQIEKGVNPVALRKYLEEILPLLLKYIDEHSIEVNNVNDLEKIALISSNNQQIASIIKKAYLEVGEDGIINIEESKTHETYLELVKGYVYDKGYLSPYLINNQEKGLAELVNPYILIIDHKITTMNELVPFLEVAIAKNSPMLIICEDIETEVLNTVVLNKLRGVFNCVITKAPYYGDKQRKTLEDLATISGATIINNNFVESTYEVLLGKANKVIVKRDTTTIIDGLGKPEKIKQRITELQQQLSTEDSSYEKTQLENRISKIGGTAAIIKVGATTETALKELHLRAEDALNATKAAMDSGIIEGGGKVFYELANSLDELQITGPAASILKTTLMRPFFQILENAGCNKKEVLRNINGVNWYDASTNTYGSNLEKGIIDPTSVAKTCLTNAISIASIFLTTECAIIDEKAKEVNNDLI